MKTSSRCPAAPPPARTVPKICGRAVGTARRLPLPFSGRVLSLRSCDGMVRGCGRPHAEGRAFERPLVIPSRVLRFREMVMLPSHPATAPRSTRSQEPSRQKFSQSGEVFHRPVGVTERDIETPLPPHSRSAHRAIGFHRRRVQRDNRRVLSISCADKYQIGIISSKLKIPRIYQIPRMILRTNLVIC